MKIARINSEKERNPMIILNVILSHSTGRYATTMHTFYTNCFSLEKIRYRTELQRIKQKCFTTQAGFDITKIKPIVDFLCLPDDIGSSAGQGIQCHPAPCKDLHSTPLGLGIKEMHILHSSPFPSDLGTMH